MSHTPEDIAALRTRGLRVTPQREAVLCALHTLRGHITAEAVYQHARMLLPSVGLATVYRNLEVLREQGVAVSTNMGDGTIQWELAHSPPHHHAICRSCGGVIQLEHVFVRDLEEKLHKELGFAADLSHMAFFGRCVDCCQIDKST